MTDWSLVDRIALVTVTGDHREDGGRHYLVLQIVNSTEYGLELWESSFRIPSPFLTVTFRSLDSGRNVEYCVSMAVCNDWLVSVLPRSAYERAIEIPVIGQVLKGNDNSKGIRVEWRYVLAPSGTNAWREYQGTILIGPICARPR